jgi:signal transduction histidine kinase
MAAAPYRLLEHDLSYSRPLSNELAPEVDTDREPDAAILDGQLADARLVALFGNGHAPYLAQVLIAPLAAYVLWEQLHRRAAVAWFAAFVLVMASRSALLVYHKRNPACIATSQWNRLFLIGSVCSGLLWGLAPWLIPIRLQVSQTIAGPVTGIVAVGSILLSADNRAALAYLLSVLLPFVAREVRPLDQEGLLTGLLLASFGVLMSIILRRMSRSFDSMKRLQLRNELLLQRLEDARANLERRVFERTVELEYSLAQQKEAEAQARAAVRARDEFLAIASHELRTPMMALVLQVKILGKEAAAQAHSPSFVARVAKLDRQLLRLSRLIDTVMTASGLGDSHAIPADSAPQVDTDLGQLVRMVVTELDGTNASGDSHVRLDLAEGVVGPWDPIRTEQIVQNLVSNAIKYGRGRPVMVKVSAGSDGAVLAVQDAGDGIPEPDIAHVFEKFFRARGDEKISGLGIGLYVVKQLVNRMGGAVSVESRIGEGTRFAVRLPFHGLVRLTE